MVTLIYDNGVTQGTREAKPKLWKRALRAFTNPRRGENTLMVIVLLILRWPPIIRSQRIWAKQKTLYEQVLAWSERQLQVETLIKWSAATKDTKRTWVFTLATFYVNNRSPGPGLCLWLRARIFLGECFRSGVNMWQMECFRSKGSHVTCGHWRRQFLEKEDSVAGRDSHWLWMRNWKTRLVVGVNIIGGWILYLAWCRISQVHQSTLWKKWDQGTRLAVKQLAEQTGISCKANITS